MKIWLGKKNYIFLILRVVTQLQTHILHRLSMEMFSRLKMLKLLIVLMKSLEPLENY